MIPRPQRPHNLAPIVSGAGSRFGVDKPLPAPTIAALQSPMATLLHFRPLPMEEFEEDSACL